MAFHPLRTALYAALFIFSAILLGLTSARIRRTNRERFGDPLHPNRRTGYYEPTVAELLATSIIALLWSLFGMCAICGAFALPCASYLSEIFMLSALWILFLVGAAISTHWWHNLGWCRPWSHQCRLVSGIISFSWIAWAVTTFLLIASIASWVSGRHSFRHPIGKEEEAGVAGTRAGTRGHARGGTPPRTAQPDTRGVATGQPVTGGAYQQPTA